MRTLLRHFGWGLIALGLFACGPDPDPDTTWRPAYDATETGWLMNAWGPSADDVHAVGGSLAEGRVVHFDGASWTRVDLEAQIGGSVPLLNWTHGFAGEGLFVVGNEGVILRRDGERWRRMESPTDQDLWGVWGASPDDVWAVGGTARRPGGVATLLHFDGATWSPVELPPIRDGVHALFKVWGSGPDDVYAVGQRGIVLHCGGACTETASWQELFVGAEADLVALWGTGPDRVLAVGGGGNGVAARWDGTEWHTETLVPLPKLFGVWMRDEDTVHIGGLRGTLATLDFETMQHEEQSIADTRDFHCLYGVDGELFAVGGNLADPSDPRGLAFFRDLEGDE